ncbi:MAG: hypothetical protein ACO387_05280 [Flavobacteriaceae bacterium]
MLRLSFIFSLLFSLYLQGHHHEPSGESYLNRNSASEVTQAHSSRFGWSLSSFLEVEEFELEEENEDQESTRTFLEGLSSPSKSDLYLRDYYQLQPTTLYTFSTQKKTALFVLFDQLLI